jgi:benzoylformate decarboxylase
MGLLYNAHRTGTPLVIYVGQHSPSGVVQEAILAADLVRIAEPLTKWAVEVHNPADIPTVLRRAFKVAAEPPRGPVFVSIPISVMDQTAEVSIAPSTRTHWRARPDPAAVQEASAILADARRPVIVYGDGVATSGAVPEAVQLAETLGATVYSSFAVQLTFPFDHPLYQGLLNLIRPTGLRSQLAQADAVLIVGSPAFRLLFPLPESPFPAETKVIQIDPSPWELAKNWPATLAMVADPLLGLRDLLTALSETLSPAASRAAEARLEAAREQRTRTVESFESVARSNWDAVPITVPRLMKELGDCLEPSTIIYDESITSSLYLSRYLKISEPGAYFRHAGGGLGCGLPGALGVKLARPERPVVGVVGDGSALYTIQALWTAAHHRIPVTYVICNNASYRILKVNMLDYLGEAAAQRRFVAMDLTDPLLDFARLAEAFGVRGRRVEHPDDLRPVLREALASGEPSLVDVMVEGGVGGMML